MLFCLLKPYQKNVVVSHGSRRGSSVVRVVTPELVRGAEAPPGRDQDFFGRPLTGPLLSGVAFSLELRRSASRREPAYSLAFPFALATT